jgi:2-C-methyl-D-erythritol 4-phosphate cytidylyltransferase
MAVLPEPAPRWWVVIPAAGRSARMGESQAKQYIEVAGRTLIEWAAAPFLARGDCSGIVVVLDAADRRWHELALARDPRVRTAFGGAQRADSVLAGLDALADRAATQDWVLVHDAARPCLADRDLEALITTLWNDAVGGLLAAPVVDTLKRAAPDGRVRETVARESLWRALTPQMFRYGMLCGALRSVAVARRAVTDEAQAVEEAGLQPKLVAGSPDNLKVTVPSDLEHVRRVLESFTGGRAGRA